MIEKSLLSEKLMFRLTVDQYQRLVKRADQQQRSMSNLTRILVVRALNDPHERAALTVAHVSDKRSE